MIVDEGAIDETIDVGAAFEVDVFGLGKGGREGEEMGFFRAKPFDDEGEKTVWRQQSDNFLSVFKVYGAEDDPFYPFFFHSAFHLNAFGL